MSILKEKDIPKSIILDNFTYSFKEKKKNQEYAYRCKNRKCGVIISINEVNLLKIINNIPNSNLEYTKVSKKDHSCDKGNIITNTNNAKSIKETKDLASNIIRQNIEKSLYWHIKNLKDNNINLSYIQIKNLLQQLREECYPNNEDFLIDISKIRITFSENNNNLKNIPFCMINANILNKKKNRQEKFILFTSEVQIKKIQDCEQLFMDGTFHSCPKNYYQLYNIIGKEKNSGVILPLIFIITTNKSYSLYYNIFSYIKSLINEYSLEINFKKMFIMMDFEKPSRKAIKDIFPECNLMGCFFHFSKALWNKAKKKGLLKKEYFKKTYTLIFSLKIYIFIRESEKEEYLKEIKNYFKENQKFKSLIDYFEKYWSKNNFLNFEKCDSKDIMERTDNICETFHNKLNNLVGNPHPKISFLIEKIKDLTTTQFNKLLDSVLLSNDNKETTFNVFDDIYNFVKKAKDKFNIKLSFELIKKLEEKDDRGLSDLSIQIINKVLNIDLDENNDIILSDEKNKEEIEINNNVEFSNDSNLIENKKIEYDNIFDLDKNRKLNKNKKFELTEFYILNDDLEFKKYMKSKK